MRHAGIAQQRVWLQLVAAGFLGLLGGQQVAGSWWTALAVRHADNGDDMYCTAVFGCYEGA
jgi:hypothetical protein